MTPVSLARPFGPEEHAARGVKVVTRQRELAPMILVRQPLTATPSHVRLDAAVLAVVSGVPPKQRGMLLGCQLDVAGPTR